MNDLIGKSDTYVAAHEKEYLDELLQFLSIASVSTLPEHKPDMERAVSFLLNRMEAAGLEGVRRIATQGNPLVYGEWLHAAGAPTVLCYGHYDVQPPDPLNEWVTPPFEPTLRDGNIYARGASDDKGQAYAHIKAVDALMKSTGKLPVNVRFLIEGEEEVGGEAVDSFVKQHSAELKCNCALVSDTAMFAPGLPALDIGLRGMVYTEVEVQGAERDLHSGLYGGVAPNPLEALARIVCGLKSPQGRILIPGFYDRVQAPGAEELESWSRLPFDEEAFRRIEVRSPALTGEAEFPPLQRTWSRPTLDVHGVPGGFIGPGSKTVIPARASAKISMRLVPNQDPAEIFKLFEAAVRQLTPAGCTSKVKLLNSADPVMVSPKNSFIQTGAAAMKRVFGAEPVYIRSGGSIPIVSLFDTKLNAPTVMMGFGLPDDGLHSPNEKFAVANYFGGIRAVSDFLLGAGKA